MSLVDNRGVSGDRRRMVIDERDRFVTRRDLRAMALLSATPTSNGLTISGPSGECHVTTHGADAPETEAIVWRDTIAVQVANRDADAFLTDALGRPVRLAYQHDASRRGIDPRFSLRDDHVSLADGFPLLVTTDASLAALNQHLAVPVSMARIRPNLVIAGAEPWQADRWRRIRIGTMDLRITRPCSRCIVVMQQPDTGERLERNEPLATLRAMGRRTLEGIMFGQNAIPEQPGMVSAGDAATVIEEGEPRPVGRPV